MMARSMFGTQRREWWRIHATFVILDVATGDPRWADWSASRYRTYFPKLELIVPGA